MAVQNIDRANQMAAMRLEGKTLQEVGNVFGLTRERVRQITKGMKPFIARPNVQGKKDEVKRLHDSGMTVKQIMDKTGYCYRSIRNYLGLTGWELSEEQRFWNMVEVVPGACWKWKGAKLPFGYGRFRWNGEQECAHRASWMIHNGPIPDGLVVMHKCDNPECSNPEHLQLGTQADNIHDRDAKGRGRSGRKMQTIQSGA
jgi:hypothetical protein